MGPAAVTRAAQMHHRHAVRSETFFYLGEIERNQPVGRIRSWFIEIIRVDVFLVEHQQTFIAARAVTIAGGIETKEGHAVMIVADLLFLLLPTLRRIAEPSRCSRIDWFAPWNDGLSDIAARHHDRIARRDRDGNEAKHAFGRRRRWCWRRVIIVIATRQPRTGEKTDRSSAKSALQHRAA